MSVTKPLLLTFLGDDNTGSADAMEALAKAGVSTVLFLDPPAPNDLDRFPQVEAVGVASMTRAMPPGEMQTALRPALGALAMLGAPLCHYKVCSTFDSAPHVGSIGCAIDVGMEVFGSEVVPLLVGAPALGRYMLFGNLFASVAGGVARLDRHPSMSRHPITPMSEADLRLHLAPQTRRRVGSFDILALDGRWSEVQERFDSYLSRGEADVVMFDVLDEARLETAGRLIWRQASRGSRFVVGSSGVEYALVAALRAQGRLPREAPAFPRVAPEAQTLVVSGSCSRETQAQIEHALAQGFEGIDVNAPALLDPAHSEGARVAAVKAAVASVEAGRSPLLYSARGPDDARITLAESLWKARNAGAGGPGRAIGEQLGLIMKAVLERVNAGHQRRLRRLIVAGGDTSGHAARSLGAKALTVVCPTAPGSPLCQAHADDPLVDGLEVLLKGGQVGKRDFFTAVRDGKF